MAGRKLELEALTLERGSHEPGEAMCVMEAVAFMAGEEWTDAPACACPVISAFLRNWNDSLPHDERQQLKKYIPKLIGTNGGDELAERRAWMATDWLVRDHTPAWLDLAGLKEQAQTLRALPELVSAETAAAIQPSLEAVRKDAAAARAAAWAASGDAAWDAAWAAAGAAAWAAAGAAARDAAMAAAWDAAGDAAWDAMRQTSQELQASAHALVDRMIALQPQKEAA